jgi:hypothetical protein
MPALLNPRHEAFAQFVVNGLDKRVAYRRAATKNGRGGPGKPENDRIHAAELMRMKGVKERIQELQEVNARKAQMSRDEALAFLADAVRTSAGAVDPDSWVVQSVKRSEDGTVVEIKLPDKTQCISQMARMCGWNAAEKVEFGISDKVRSYLEDIRSKPMVTLSAGDPAALKLVAPPVIEAELSPATPEPSAEPAAMRAGPPSESQQGQLFSEQQ